MVSPAMLALLTSLALAAVSPNKAPSRIQSGNSSGKCSIPLLNAFKGAPEPMNWTMPVIRPGEIGRMPMVEPPAPPCAQWPLK